MIIVSEHERKKIIPFGGGKGGTGKTLIAINTAIRLGQQGRKVLLVDLDLGGSNAHTYLHIKNQHYGIANYIYNDQLSLNDIIQETQYQNLHFIAGDVLSPGIAHINSNQFREALNEIVALPYDYIVLDLASGSRSISLHAFTTVNAGVLVTTPTIASTLNAYNFFKSAIFNMMFRYGVERNQTEVVEYMRTIMEEHEPNATPKMNDILLAIDRIDSGASAELREQLYCMKPFVILNGIRAADDLEHIRNLQNLIHKNMNITLECLGAVFQDNESADRALEAKVPIIETEIDSHMRNGIDRIAQKILLSPDFPILPLDLEMYDNSFELVEIEVQQDLEQVPEDIVALEREEYLALIESQKQKIAQLEQQATAHMPDTLSMRSGEIQDIPADLRDPPAQSPRALPEQAPPSPSTSNRQASTAPRPRAEGTGEEPAGQQ